jgi:glycosyltransferase involved in cell wall biosynthesis
MPFIFEGFDLNTYDLVLSLGSAEAKGVITKPGTRHIHYSFTPTRYLWSHRHHYLASRQFGLLQPLLRPLIAYLLELLRVWDRVAASRPDEMISISTHVKKRIARYYHRDAEVIFPPVDTAKFKGTVSLCHRVTANPYYLVVSRLVPYKKIDFLVQLCTRLSRPLVVVGSGVEARRLRQLAGPTIHFAGQVADSELSRYYKSCRAFLQANTEDFGIAMVEAQAAGKPVIAYGKGGSCDIVQDGVTGILVQSPTFAAWEQALLSAEQTAWSEEACRQNAERFAISTWRRTMTERIQNLYAVTS